MLLSHYLDKMQDHICTHLQGGIQQHHALANVGALELLATRQLEDKGGSLACVHERRWDVLGVDGLDEDLLELAQAVGADEHALSWPNLASIHGAGDNSANVGDFERLVNVKLDTLLAQLIPVLWMGGSGGVRLVWCAM